MLPGVASTRAHAWHGTRIFICPGAMEGMRALKSASHALYSLSFSVLDAAECARASVRER